MARRQRADSCSWSWKMAGSSLDISPSGAMAQRYCGDGKKPMVGTPAVETADFAEERSAAEEGGAVAGSGKRGLRRQHTGRDARRGTVTGCPATRRSPRMDSPAFLPVWRLSEEMAAGRLSPVEIVEDCIARTERLEPKLQAYVSFRPERARMAAEAADKAIRSGGRIGPLHGVPIAVKDLVEIEGEVAQGGCAAWNDRVATRTATLYRKLHRRRDDRARQDPYGGVRLRGVGDELRNAWERRGIAGMSRSTGRRAAPAAARRPRWRRIAPCAISTDTGGSVRIPPRWCGLTGLETTIGRISAYGVLPLSPTLDTPGPITRSVEDAATLPSPPAGRRPARPAHAGGDRQRSLVPSAPRRRGTAPRAPARFRARRRRRRNAGCL